MGYLIDTNIVSELRKETRCNPGVTRWFDATDEDELFLSVLTLGRFACALTLARRGPAGAPHLEAWVNALHAKYASHSPDRSRSSSAPEVPPPCRTRASPRCPLGVAPPRFPRSARCLPCPLGVAPRPTT